ncbi:MAG: roadblock/LC7 domain-containing protein [Deinococcales bacterium]
MEKQATLKALLDNLKTQIPQLEAALVVAKDGASVAQFIQASDDVEQIATLAATTLALSRRMSSSLIGTDMTSTVVSSGAEQIHLYAAGGKGVLVLVTSQGVGDIQASVCQTAQAVAQLLA